MVYMSFHASYSLGHVLLLPTRLKRPVAHADGSFGKSIWHGPGRPDEAILKASGALEVSRLPCLVHGPRQLVEIQANLARSSDGDTNSAHIVPLGAGARDLGGGTLLRPSASLRLRKVPLLPAAHVLPYGRGTSGTAMGREKNLWGSVASCIGSGASTKTTKKT